MKKLFLKQKRVYFNTNKESPDIQHISDESDGVFLMDSNILWGRAGDSL